jgi:hypothetical protein
MIVDGVPVTEYGLTSMEVKLKRISKVLERAVARAEKCNSLSSCC